MFLPSRLLLSFLLVTATAAALRTQNAAYSLLAGTATLGCSPVGPSVEHQALNLPRFGSTFQVRVAASNGTCSYLCNLQLLAIGCSNTHFGSLPLPALPLQLGLPGCGQLRIAPDLQTWVPVGTTPVTLGFPVPADPSLAGVQFHVQSIAATWILGGLGSVALGRAGVGTIGW